MPWPRRGCRTWWWSWATQARAIRDAVRWRSERIEVNPRPQDGLSSSLRIGLDVAAEDRTVDAVLVLLGDQPAVRPEVISAVLAAAETAPSRSSASATPATGHPTPCSCVEAPGRLPPACREIVGSGPCSPTAPTSSPRLPSPAPTRTSIPRRTWPVSTDARPHVAARLEAAWAERVRANRDQAERLRESTAGDHYAPISGLFVADPRRTDEPALEMLRAMAVPDETWLDIGAGAGRYALPLALRVHQVIAVEPSPAMRRAMRAGIDEHGLANVRVIAGAWPESAAQLEPLPAADVSLIAHVGYDIEAIGPFLGVMEEATRDRCVAILTDRSPASVADPFWPLVHGEDRVALPALPDLVELLLARGCETEVVRVERSLRSFDSVEALTAFLRRQLFITEGGPKDLHFRAVMPDRIRFRDGAWTLADRPAGSIGIVTWRAPAVS